MKQLTYFEDLDPLWCSWFTGFTDGEGYFQIGPNGPHNFFTALTITLREDDKHIVEEIQSTLMCGNIYYISYKHDRAKGNHSCNQWRWKVSRISHVVGVIIPLFDQYPLRTKKSMSYSIFRKASLLRNSQLPDRFEKNSDSPFATKTNS